MGTAVDEFLALVHEWSRSNPDGMFDILDKSLHALNYDRLLSARTRTICHCCQTSKSDQHPPRIYILDWELARTGLPGSEIGLFCAYLVILSQKN